MLRIHLPPRRRSYLREGATARVATEPNASPSLPTLRPASPSRPSPSRLRPRPEPPRGRTTSTAPTRPSRVAPASTPSARDKSPENSATLAKTTSTPNPTRKHAIRSGLHPFRPSRQFRPSFRLFVSTSARRASGIRPVPSRRASTEATRHPGRRRPTLSRPPPPPFSSSRPPPVVTRAPSSVPRRDARRPSTRPATFRSRRCSPSSGK